MSRPVNPNSQFTIKPHIVGMHTYASTQPWEIDAASGRKRYRYVHWGTISDNTFHPNSTYLSASTEVQRQLIFPPGLDMSEANGGTPASGAGRPSYTGEPANRLYGHIWLLEQVAEKTGIRQDLLTIFDGDRQKTDIVLTLAIFPYLTRFTYNRLERWQRTDRAPCDRPLSPDLITRFTQSLTEKHRHELLGLRAARLAKDEVCCVDSTSRSAYGDSLADVCWGKNKEHLPLPQTLEVVVYTLAQHMPVYYRTFPGNMNDSRSLRVIFEDMDNAGFPSVVYMTDRGYESMRNIESMILKNRRAVLCVKTSTGLVSEKIQAFGDFAVRPDCMEIDLETKCYMTQYPIEYKVRGNGQCVHEADRMKLNLYFDPVRRSSEIVALDARLKADEQELATLLASNRKLDGVAAFRKEYPFFELVFDESESVLKSFCQNRKKIEAARRLSGFVALLTLGLDWTPAETLGHYRLRDEQEKYFEQMKEQMVADRQRNWSEEGKTGRLLILFVSLILGSYIRYVWKHSSLHKEYSSSLEVLDEMRPIRCIEQPHKARIITPFLKRQLEICTAFGFTPPRNCDKTYKSRKVTATGKRGRPRKSPTVSDL